MSWWATMKRWWAARSSAEQAYQEWQVARGHLMTMLAVYAGQPNDAVIAAISAERSTYLRYRNAAATENESREQQ